MTEWKPMADTYSGSDYYQVQVGGITLTVRKNRDYTRGSNDSWLAIAQGGGRSLDCYHLVSSDEAQIVAEYLARALMHLTKLALGDEKP